MDGMSQFNFSSSSPIQSELSFDQIEQTPVSSPAETAVEPRTFSWTDTSRENTYDLNGLKEDLATLSLPLDAEMESIEASIAPVVHFDGTPPYYVGVLEAGEGAHASVTFCLPKYFVVAAKWWANHGEPFSIEKLKSKLVAVKVARSLKGIEDVNGDADMREIIEGHMREHPSSAPPGFCSLRGRSSAPVPSFFDELPNDSSTYWMAMDAVFPSVDLQKLQAYCDDVTQHPIPEMLVYHIFLEVMKAILALQDRNTRIFHLDLHEGNILLAPTDGLPGVIVTDFGHAKQEEDGLHPSEADFQSLQSIWIFICSTNDGLCKHDHSSCHHSKYWPEFSSGIDAFSPLKRSVVPMTTKSQLQSLVEPTRNALAAATPQDRVKIAELLKAASRGQETMLTTNFRRMGLIPK